VPFVANLGRQFRVEFYARPRLATAPQPILPFVSLALAANPIPIPPLGRVQLDAPVVPLPFALASVPVGTVALVVSLPNVGALAGLPLCLQSVVQHEEDPATWRLTNATADTILR
jgi:hypothetical protein